MTVAQMAVRARHWRAMEFSVTLDGEPDVAGTLPAADVVRLLASLNEAVQHVLTTAILVHSSIAAELGLAGVEDRRLTLTANGRASVALDALLHAGDEDADPRVMRTLVGLAESIGVGDRYRAVVLRSSGAGRSDEVRLDEAFVQWLRSSSARVADQPPALAEANAAFHARPTIAELAERQGVTGPVDVGRLYDAEATDEERDAFMAAIAELG